ncbi:hypothetical protein [Mechercharimyces sp. CAU 1602]|uniref:hypothetical protein n=1 Tax=Mechercharimyces sp. CAU 1602 TaxID=2973933 RepID=UPI002162DEFB|nr:hypothetical protein [Mechercharimyces sp. CAU 1602]MCS1350745.1 hypothetical protein [Mechercharimyces sp. CAU 1602]
MEKPITKKKKRVDVFFKITNPIVIITSFIMVLKTDNDIWMNVMLAYVTGMIAILNVMEFIEKRKEIGKLKKTIHLFAIAFVTSAFVYCIVNMFSRS